jgi:MFS transporter, DHA1 family, multidrug resistance protein
LPLNVSDSFNSAFALTIYTAGINQIIVRFNVSMTLAILGFSLYLIGIAFAPIYTPHLSERYGRRIVYLVSLPLCAVFLIGTGASQTFAALAICRFLAGFTGGPCLVLIEGTFADVWSPAYTVTYYSFLTLASYIGAACGMFLPTFVKICIDSTFRPTRRRLCGH